ncbi:glycosyltransferase family 25 protein [Pseudoalteromonas sp. GB56]
MRLITYVINLERSQDRLARITNELNALSLDYEVVPAVDGANLLPEQLAQYDQVRNQKNYHKPLSAGEIGCVLSHKKALTTFLASDYDVLLLLEDDTCLASHVHEVIDSVITNPQWDTIKFYSGKKAKKVRKKVQITATHSICYPQKVPNSMLAQLVTRCGAEKMLAMYENFYMPADISLQPWWQTNLNVLMCQPNIATPFECDSEIDRLSARKSVRYSTWKRLRQRITFEIKRLVTKPNYQPLEQLGKH